MKYKAYVHPDHKDKLETVKHLICTEYGDITIVVPNEIFMEMLAAQMGKDPKDRTFWDPNKCYLVPETVPPIEFVLKKEES